MKLQEVDANINRVQKLQVAVTGLDFSKFEKIKKAIIIQALLWLEKLLADKRKKLQDDL